MKEILNILNIKENLDDAILIWDQIERDHIIFNRKIVDNKEDYIDALRSFDPDIIISDFTHTKFNGMEAIRIRNEIAPTVPFILVTGSIDETVAIDCMKAGADDYIMKRNLSRLGEAIKSTIRNKEILRQKNSAEKLLKESEEKYRSVVEHLPDAVLVHTMRKILYASPATLKLLKADSFNQIKDMDLISFVHADYKKSATERIRKIYETGKPQGYVQGKYLNLRNEIIDVEVIGIPITYLGEPAIQTIIRDITERKRVEEELIKAKEKAEESDQLKTAFLHNISHEIRTPMNAIVGFSALLNEPDLTQEEQQSYLKIIIDSSDQLLAIVNDIIEISNIEVGILKKNLNEINLNIQMKMLYNQFRHKAVEKNIELTFHSSLDEDIAWIITDSTKLIQIFTNLLGNAFKFTKQGKIKFGYTLKDDLLEFFVSDTGIGISTDQHQKIFERFYQVESSASRAYEGTGLGLAITKAYVELLGGNIWLKSVPGTGSIFFFTIPYRRTSHKKTIRNGNIRINQRQKEISAYC
jgi:PAS domain S-box-containing protein